MILKNDCSGVGPNDLALVRLASALPLSESIQPVLLPVAGSDALGNAVFSGWGDTSTVGWIHDYPLILQYANVTVLTYDGEFLFAPNPTSHGKIQLSGRKSRL